jgi:hypothetical protein
MIILPIERAVGKPLAHDITRIIPGKSKGPAFKRGHIVTVDDLPILRNLGKNAVYVFEPDSHYVHEDDAAQILADSCQTGGFTFEGPSEGRINIKAQICGLLKINMELLTHVNRSGTIVFSTVHQNTACFEGMTAAATKIIPVAMKESLFWPIVQEVKDKGPLLALLPFSRNRIGVVVTGAEVFSGRIKDGSLDILSPKVEAFGGKIVSHRICPDREDAIAETIGTMAEQGCDVIITTGGLSVDADDVTLSGIVGSGATLISYGSPVLPGAMFALAYLGDIPILGAPAAIFYYKATALDIFLPRTMAGDSITREDIANLGHGGLCLLCEECVYPVCPFGKGE